jgi:hypothetical protein
MPRTAARRIKLAGIQTALAAAVSAGDETTGATCGQDLQALLNLIVERAQESVTLANDIVARINNGGDSLSIALTICINNFLT